MEQELPKVGIDLWVLRHLWRRHRSEAESECAEDLARRGLVARDVGTWQLSAAGKRASAPLIKRVNRAKTREAAFTEIAHELAYEHVGRRFGRNGWRSEDLERAAVVALEKPPASDLARRAVR